MKPVASEVKNRERSARDAALVKSTSFELQKLMENAVCKVEQRLRAECSKVFAHSGHDFDPEAPVAKP